MSERPRPPIAVALHYNASGSGAPRVVAKGGGEIAEKIIETAREHNVPLQEDAALASALSKLEIGREIPKELYQAVAHVLAFAWSIAGKNGVATAPPPPAPEPAQAAEARALHERALALPTLKYSNLG